MMTVGLELASTVYADGFRSMAVTVWPRASASWMIRMPFWPDPPRTRKCIVAVDVWNYADCNFRGEVLMKRSCMKSVS